MSRANIGGAVLAFGVWLIFAVAMIGPNPIKPSSHIWVVTGSEHIASHPDLVRAANPFVLAQR
jgi:hypothetical protein